MIASNGTDERLQARGLLASLGAELPVIAAPMAGGPTTPELVVAAARSGGLGFLAGGYKTTEQLSQQVAEVRRSTDRFGVNLFVPNTVPITLQAFTTYARALRARAARYDIDLTGLRPYESDDDWDTKVEALVSDPVPVVSFTFGLPSIQVISRLQRAGSVTVQTVTTVREAIRAASHGVDAVVVQASAAGGHSATLTPTAPTEDVALPVLVHRVASEVHLPIWAAGGLASPAQVNDVLAVGAEAAAVGTVLLRSTESGASKTYKDALADTTRTETVLTKAFSGRPARALRNGFVDAFDAIAPDGYPAIHYLTAPIRKAAAMASDPDNINLWAGTGHRYATDEPAGTILLRLATLTSPENPAQQHAEPRPK